MILASVRALLSAITQESATSASWLDTPVPEWFWVLVIVVFILFALGLWGFLYIGLLVWLIWYAWNHGAAGFFGVMLGIGIGLLLLGASMRWRGERSENSK